MKHSKLQNYQLINNSAQNSSSPTLSKNIQKFLLFIARLAIGISGSLLFFVNINDYMHSGSLDALFVGPMGIVLIGFSIWKSLGETIFSILRIIVAILSGSYGIITALAILDPINSGDISTGVVLAIITISMLGICYFSCTNAPTAMPTVKDLLFESLPEAITKRIKKTTPDLFCTQIIAINVKKKIPHSAVALLSTGQEITVELEQTDDFFDISIPPFTPQPNLKPKL